MHVLITRVQQAISLISWEGLLIRENTWCNLRLEGKPARQMITLSQIISTYVAKLLLHKYFSIFNRQSMLEMNLNESTQMLAFIKNKENKAMKVPYG